MRSGSTSTHSATPPFIVTASGCAPPIPPSPAVSVIAPAHPAGPGRQRDRPRQRAAVPAPRDLREALVGALHDSLAADVDPRAGGHLAVHRQPRAPHGADPAP